MKVNEIPEKIYVPTAGLEMTDKLPCHIEYTRTDTFIEKACEFIASNMRCDGYTLQTKAKFINEFENYMKGE